MLHQSGLSYNRIIAPKAYKWSYLLSSETNWTRKAFLLHKTVILRLMADFAIKKLDLL